MFQIVIDTHRGLFAVEEFIAGRWLRLTYFRTMGEAQAFMRVLRRSAGLA